MAGDDVIARLNGILPDLQAEEVEDRSIDQFMDAIYELYLWLGADINRWDDPRFTAFIEASSDIVETRWRYIGLYYIGKLRTYLTSTWYGGEWVMVCRRRSALAALQEIYLVSIGNSFDTEELDEIIRRVGKTEAFFGDEERPSEIPEEHWWWFL
jgi:hypothetical protein